MTRIGDIGTAKVIKSDEKYAFYVSLALLKPKHINSDFLCNSIASNNFQKGLKARSLLTAIPQKINKEEIGKVATSFSLNLSEQEKIGSFFSHIESLLTLHQRKWVEFFYPTYFRKFSFLNFWEFFNNRITNAWEQRKLGELYEKAGSGGTPNASNASFYMGTIPFLGISDIKGRYITKTAKHISEKGLKSSAAWMVPSGAISLAMYASVGKVGITSVELATSQAFYNMVFASSSLRNFIFSRLEKASDNDEWLPLVSTGTQSNLNADKIKNWCISVPNSNEQKLVGEFFKKLDNLLTLHQRQSVSSDLLGASLHL